MGSDLRNWLLLAAAIALEVTATLSLRAAVDHPGWVALAAAGYAGAFVALAVLLRRGAPISVIYGVWSAAGVALTAVLAALVFGEQLTLTIGVGIAIVIVGVVLVETGSPHQAPDAHPASVDGDRP
ncbi:SMR family transporter [Herbiconiux sp. CPCC 205716]|uniref:SMR family transporter n=1 Tax=Herbiconiux gentiana TaxID=2970912 RepID=A0ABT2GD13_9MICO|nr:SMR family transporter [Herbiconiux gentiana]MCS5714006.1 SMR family transporter [Herbiconiux gentiana]